MHSGIVNTQLKPTLLQILHGINHPVGFDRELLPGGTILLNAAQDLEGEHLSLRDVDALVLVGKSCAIIDRALACLFAVVVHATTRCERVRVQSQEGETADAVGKAATDRAAGGDGDGDLIVSWVLVLLVNWFGAAERVWVGYDLEVCGRLGERSVSTPNSCEQFRVNSPC